MRVYDLQSSGISCPTIKILGCFSFRGTCVEEVSAIWQLSLISCGIIATPRLVAGYAFRGEGGFGPDDQPL